MQFKTSHSGMWVQMYKRHLPVPFVRLELHIALKR